MALRTRNAGAGMQTGSCHVFFVLIVWTTAMQRHKMVRNTEYPGASEELAFESSRLIRHWLRMFAIGVLGGIVLWQWWR